MTILPRYKYFCSVCSGSVTKKPCIAVREKPKDKKPAPLSGLGGWRCEKGCHATKRFASVVRDLSGGKEVDKSRRETPWSVSRPLLVIRKLNKEDKND